MDPQPLSKPGSEERRELESLAVELESEPGDWKLRKRVVQLQYNLGQYADAADTIWSAPEIPPVDVEIAFSARALARGKPRRALRLLHAVLEQNDGKPVKNLAIANALLHHGMVMEASRFYGAAVSQQPAYMDPEFEYWLMWCDDTQRLWGDWQDLEMKLEELPWIKRDEEALKKLEDTAEFRITTPIEIPNLPRSRAEELEEISHVKPDANAEAPVKAPPSVQFTEEAVKELGDSVVIPGQRQEDEASPTGSVQKPTEAQASGEKSGRGMKLVLPGNRAVNTNKVNVGPAEPAAPSIVLPGQESEEDKPAKP